MCSSRMNTTWPRSSSKDFLGRVILRFLIELQKKIVSSSLWDRGFGDIRRHPPGTHPGIVVIRLRDQRASLVERVVRGLLARHELGDFSGCVVSVQPGTLRVRRPED